MWGCFDAVRMKGSGCVFKRQALPLLKLIWWLMIMVRTNQWTPKEPLAQLYREANGRRAQGSNSLKRV